MPVFGSLCNETYLLQRYKFFSITQHLPRTFDLENSSSHDFQQFLLRPGWDPTTWKTSENLPKWGHHLRYVGAAGIPVLPYLSLYTEIAVSLIIWFLAIFSWDFRRIFLYLARYHKMTYILAKVFSRCLESKIWKIYWEGRRWDTPLDFDIVANRVLRPASYRRV